MSDQSQTTNPEISDEDKYPKPEGYLEPTLIYKDGFLTTKRIYSDEVRPNPLNTAIAIEKNPPPVIMTVANSPEVSEDEDEDDGYDDYNDNESYW